MKAILCLKCKTVMTKHKHHYVCSNCGDIKTVEYIHGYYDGYAVAKQEGKE